MSSGLFRYTPLDAATRNIRLLRFKRRRSNGLELSLETYDVGACPGFIALSYVWGPEDPSHMVDLDGGKFSIRHNLWFLLRRLGHGVLREKYFWIDAICIDQKNPRERGHQVNLMKDIFSTANLTIAWIGPSNEDSDFVMDHCVNRKHASYHKLHMAALAAKKLLRRPYFERVWIVQEVLLSQRLLILCGFKECWWEDLDALLYDPRWRHEIDIPDGIDALFRVRGVHGTGRGLPMELHRLLYDFHSKKCSDPRDHVYALLGLVTDEDKRGKLQADYTISPQLLYYRTMLYFGDSFSLRSEPEYAVVVENKLAAALKLDKNLAAAIRETANNRHERRRIEPHTSVLTDDEFLVRKSVDIKRLVAPALIASTLGAGLYAGINSRSRERNIVSPALFAGASLATLNVVLRS
ncbi:heterokaryon incompatibility protein-domain-containing protein [Xylaria acuta]|nr:heterokaryon incompatibility protein-domain-containing protein [Xylaria acuta]